MTDISFDAADYPAIRHALIDLHQRIIKKPNPDDVKTCARHLGLLNKKILNFRNDTEVDLLTDYMVYAFRPNGFNMAEKYLRLNKSRLNEYDQALLSRMRLARYTVFQVEETNHIDKVTVADVFIKTRFTLMDHQLAKTGEKGIVLAGHILDLGDFCIQSGASLPLDKALLNADEVINALERVDDNNFVEFFLNPANGPKLARAIISASIRLGNTENVGYHEV
jgi:hypothetical protein